jgi:hypothetical protein
LGGGLPAVFCSPNGDLMTKPELILHIGYPKTGTTSIQHAMNRKRPALLQEGLSYPASPGGNMHQLVAFAALVEGDVSRMKGRRSLAGLPRQVRMDQFLRAFDTELTTLPAHVTRVVLSAETFSLIMRDTAQIEKLRALLAPYFSSMRVVVYLRRQDRLGTSFYSQLLRRGIMEPPVLTTERRDHAHLYDYEAFLARWASVFGRSAIVPRIFEPARLLNGDVVQDFYSLCGLDPGLAPERQANPSIAVQGQALLLAFGRMLEEAEGNENVRGRVWLRLVSTVTELFPGAGWRPSRAEAKDFMTRFAESNEAVRRDYFPQAASLFDEDFAKLPAAAISLEAEPVLPAAFVLIMEAMRRSVKHEVDIGVTRAQMKMQHGDPAKARKLLKRAVALGGGSVKARLELARFFAADGELDIAIGHAEAALEQDPTHPEARAYLIELNELQGAGEAQEAE